MNNIVKSSKMIHKICLLFLCILFCLPSEAQNQKKITGTITDVKGETIIGASVNIKKTSIGTVSDIDGRFSLEVPQDAILTISYIGYLSQEIAVTGQSDLQIILKEDSKVLDEIVVVGYGIMKKSDLTGSLSSVGSKALKDKPVANIGEAL